MVAHDPKWCFFLGNKNDLVVIESVYYGNQCIMVYYTTRYHMVNQLLNGR